MTDAMPADIQAPIRGGKAGHFDRLGAAVPAMAVVDRRLAILTGQSDLSQNPLSPDQRRFLAEIAPPDVDQVLTGFPFADDQGVGAARPSLFAASIANARQYLWSLGDARYRALAARAVSRLLGATRKDLILVTGSCGLAIVTAALPQRQPNRGVRCTVLALGPVGRPPPDWVRFQAVVGRRDFWSRALYRGRVDAVIDAGHLGYWTSREARAIAARLANSGVDR